MRTRRSRFFVILLHLVGVSHYYSPNTGMYSKYYSYYYSAASPGIVAVFPYPIALEQIDLYQEILAPPSTACAAMDHHQQQQQHLYNNNNDNHSNNRIRRTLWNRRQHQQQQHQQEEEDPPVPLWLQDPVDGWCLGPTGIFSECGDATLWLVERKRLPARNKLRLLSGVPESIQRPFWWGRNLDTANDAAQQPEKEVDTERRIQQTPTEIGWTFRVLDRDYEVSSAVSTPPPSRSSKKEETRRQRRERNHQAECLDANPMDLSVDVQSCRSRGGFIWQPKVRSSVWTIHSDGTLHPVASAKRVTTLSQQPSENESLCLTRGGVKGNQAILANCETQTPVQFSFLRYRVVPTSMLTLPAAAKDTPPVPDTPRQDFIDSYPNARVATKKSFASISNGDSDNTSPTLAPSTISLETSNLPVTRDRAHSQAALGPLMHPELKVASRLIFADQSKRRKTGDDGTNIHKFIGALSNTNPILLAGRNQNRGTVSSWKLTTNHLIQDTTTSSVNVKALKVRKMQTHPYLNEASQGIWTDPQTNLQYHTDLGNYLGRTRMDHGRHTLTGFGIYRKGYVIKVYGIAYYVSKRDVLADSIFESYATLTAEELRLRPDFYEVLRKMGHPHAERQNSGYFDRTIMLKTNMQLSAETMRSSLEADWSYLTDEAKRTLVGASMQGQVADDDMLALIQSPDNPSRCSCSQIAPPEYNANPDCCARGTELVFTWTKSNDLEVRLNGRLMDAFPRPDIAEGIFYEYLRYDNPISTEFLDRVVDGFPFLLGPLAQVRGISIGQTSHQKNSNPGNAIFNAATEFRDFVLSQTAEMSEMAKRSMLEAAEHAAVQAGNLAKAFGDTAMEFAKEADRRRDLMIKHTVAAPEVFLKLLSRDEATIQYFVRWMSGEPEPVIPEEHEDTTMPIRRGPRGRVFGYPLSRWFGEDVYPAPDEIGPMKIHPTINKAILTLVHLYLLLLFIVSFPGSYTTRTKLLSRKFSGRETIDDSESDSSDDRALMIQNIARDTEQVLPCDEKRKPIGFNGSQLRRYFDPGSCLPLRATHHVDLHSNRTDSGLKKKSLSYFL
jgi:hypothetical protein